MPNQLPDIGDTLKDLVWDVLIQAALAKVFSAVPWLGWGPIGAVVTVVVGLVADQLFDGMKMVFDMNKIPFVNAAHLKAYETGSVKLKLIARDKGIDSPEFKEARLATREELSTFVQFAKP